MSINGNPRLDAQVNTLSQRLDEAEATIEALLARQAEMGEQLQQARAAVEIARAEAEVAERRLVALAQANARLYQTVAAEIASRKQSDAEQARLLEENEQQRQFLERLVEQVPAGIAFLHGPEHRYVLANPEYRRIARGKGELVGRTVAETWPEIAAQVIPLMDEVYQTGQPFSTVDAPLTIQRETGLENGYFTFSFIRMGGEGNELEGVVILAVETTEQVRIRQEAEEAHALLDTFYESAPVGLAFLDRELRYTRLNPALAALNRLPAAAHLGRTPVEVLTELDNAGGVMAALEQVLASGTSVSHVEMQGRAGGLTSPTRYWRASYYPVSVKGETIGVGAIIEDITERKQAEQQLQSTLQEKETLLKEVYHRVKNNLHSIANLLYMQATHLQDEQARQMFQETQDRVHSIALIHEKLYQSGNLARLDFAEYMNSLAAYLVRSYGTDVRQIRLEVKADPVTLDMDTAMSLGMIINELVVNSLKHAFPPAWAGQSAEILIELRASGPELNLTVRDNGIGLPAEIDLASTRSLGLQLVTMLTGHMGGTLGVSRENGTTFTLKFIPPASRAA